MTRTGQLQARGASTAPSEAPGAAPPTADPGSKARRIAFRIVTWFVALGGAVLFLFGLMELILMWLPADTIVSVIDDGDLTVTDVALHRSHYHAIGVVAWAMFPALYVQLRKPHRRVAPLLQGLAIAVLALFVFAVTGAFSIMDVIPPVAFGIVAALHPRVRDLFTRPSFDGTMLRLAGVAAVPWLVYALSNARTQWTSLSGDVHGMEAHWAAAAVMGMAFVLVAIVASTNHTGWRFSTGVVAVLSVEVGVHALTFPDLASGLAAPWAIASIVWGLAFAAAGIQRSRRTAAPKGTTTAT